MSRSTRRLSSTIAAALAIGALAAPAANAVTGEQFRADTGSQSTPAVGSSYSGSGLHSTSALGYSNNSAPTVTSTSADEGFDLGSAVIGAGSAATILLLGGAGATAVSRHRRRVRLAG
jgi:hypothetical protein